MQIHALRLTVSSDVLERVVLAFTFAKQQLCVFTLCACFEGMLWNDIISFFGIVGYVPHHLGLLSIMNSVVRKGHVYIFEINVYMSTFI